MFVSQMKSISCSCHISLPECKVKLNKLYWTETQCCLWGSICTDTTSYTCKYSREATSRSLSNFLTFVLLDNLIPVDFLLLLKTKFSSLFSHFPFLSFVYLVLHLTESF